MSVDKILDEMRQGSIKKGPQCGVGAIFASLEGEHKSAMAAALDDQTIESGAISRWLLKNGHDAKPHSVARHRRKECRCDS